MAEHLKPPAELGTFPRGFSAGDRHRALANPDWLASQTIPVRGSEGNPVSLAAFNSLMDAARLKFPQLSVVYGRDDDATARTAADQWLAPRLHWALRLTRRQASDKNMWFWLAAQNQDYVRERWGDDPDENRWFGAVNKQAFARLWWSAELYRVPGSYEPALRATRLHTIVDSLLPRTFIRSRPIAQALLDFISPNNYSKAERLADTRIRELARILNFVTAGTAPEVEAYNPPDNYPVYLAWTREPIPETDWEALPPAPWDFELDPQAAAAAQAIVQRCWDYVVADNPTLIR